MRAPGPQGGIPALMSLPESLEDALSTDLLCKSDEDTEPTETFSCGDCGTETEDKLNEIPSRDEGVCDDCLGNYSECEDCSCFEHADDLHNVKDFRARGKLVCESCRDNSYAWCEDCEEYVSEDDIRQTLRDTYACRWCIDDNYHYCDDCDGYYAAGDSCGGEHDDGCECEAPHQEFRIRNDGQEPLANDTDATVTLPAGTISAEGLKQIARLLRTAASSIPLPEDFYSLTYQEQDTHEVHLKRNALHRLSYDVTDSVLGDKWQTKDGNFTKRLSRHAYKAHSVKLDPAILSEIGNVASAHSTAVDFRIQVTRNLNLSADDFGHSESCWWQSYSYSRCTLKSNGGFGLRAFSPEGGVIGRAWVQPLRLVETVLPAEPAVTELRCTGCGIKGCNVITRDAREARPERIVRSFTTTLDTETPDGFAVYNGYGVLGGYAATRLVSHLAGLTYRKVNLDISTTYVNGESGYLVTSEEIADGFTDGSLSLEVEQHATLTLDSKELADV